MSKNKTQGDREKNSHRKVSSRKGNYLKRGVISFFLGANLFAILLMWLCVVLTYISPSTIPHISLLTLAFPIFLGTNVLFLAFWLLFHARLVWVPLAGILTVGSYILDYCPLNLNASEKETEDSTLTIISYNAGFATNDERKSELLRFLKKTNADIICLQELNESFLSTHKDWLDSASYFSLYSNSIITLSRYPILGDTIHIEYPTRHNHSIACWIDFNGDSLLLINNHLESNMLSPEEKDDYAQAIKEPNRQALESSSRVLLTKLSDAASYRGAQTDTICSFIDRNAGHDIVACGDFNDTPVSYTFQRLASRLTSAYRQKGNGPGFTYSRRSFPVRIDHLFFSDRWTCLSCRIDKTISASDHYPLIVRLRKKVR